MKMTGRVFSMLDVLNFFIGNQWNWNVNNTIQLFNEMDAEDKKVVTRSPLPVFHFHYPRLTFFLIL